MTDRGVIFSGPMVRALIAGRKRQTRRLATSPLRLVVPGDRLWVREAFHATEGFTRPVKGECAHLFGYEAAPGSDREFIAPGIGRVVEFSHHLGGWGGRSSRNFPSMHMPRWASRLTLLVGRVWTEPLQAISREDCVAEGHKRSDHPFPEEVHLDAARDWYMDLWDSLHNKEGERWRDNPLVVAIEFEVRAENIDRLAA